MNRILLVEDHEIVKDAIYAYFEGSDTYQVAAYARTGVEALWHLSRSQFDLIITDLNMPEMKGSALIEQVLLEKPDQKILVLTMYDDVHTVKHLLGLGVNGYLLKNSSKDEFFEALKCIFAGDRYYTPRIYMVVMQAAIGHATAGSHSMTVELSKREEEILKLVVDQLDNQEIAEKLNISVRTVETHKRNLLKKTNSKNVAGLVVFAMEHNLT